MNNKSILILGAVWLALVGSLNSCKKADVETGTLKVIVSQGVSGTPASGTYTMNVGEQMVYRFTLDAGYQKLTVTLDGAEVAATGIVTFSGDHTLKAYSDENGKYTLTVSVGAGVTGTPAAGIYSYAEGTVVHYSYALAEGYTKISPLVDAVNATSSGTITMSANHSISVTATEKYDIRGPWALSEAYADGSSFSVTATFSGTYESGTVADNAGGSGTYTYDGSKAVFTLVFPDVTYEYSGSFSDKNTMSGTSKRYHASDNIVSGTWTATRGASTTASPGSQGKARRNQ